ncbi:MAG TPA: ribosome maturation factor RimM [Burkholderiales bacterium]|nr:ribosome maturation factor RimM [Burkholderiales bacterium]
MGRVAGSYGVRGWLKVVPGRGGAEGLTAAVEWWLGDDAYRVEEAKVHGASVVAKLAGLETREQALKLKGASVSVERGALPEPGDGRFYLADLVGLEVVNERGESLGRVQRLFSNGAQDVMEVGGDGRTRLLPWVAAVVKAVDLAQRRIRVEWGADW